MQLIDQEHKRVTDFMDSEAYSNTNNLAKSSAFAFFPKYSACQQSKWQCW